jgi:hypothetical protein
MGYQLRQIFDENCTLSGSTGLRALYSNCFTINGHMGTQHGEKGTGLWLRAVEDIRNKQDSNCEPISLKIKGHI